MKHAVYPGSFDPFTNGHLDILNRAAKLFDKITIAVLIQTNKKKILSIKKRCELIREVIKGRPKIEVKPFDGLLVDFCKQNNIKIIIRGLRTVTDFDYEYAISLMNHHMLPGIETIFLTAKNEHSFISSTIIKEIASLGGDIQKYVPQIIFERLKKLYKNS